MAATAEQFAEFDKYMSSGDYTAAGKLASSLGYNSDQVASYVNSTYGSNLSSNEVNPYMSGVPSVQAATNASPTYYDPQLPTGPDPTYQSGYGGYQPTGSTYIGDNPMPVTYQQQVPQIQDMNQQLINAAMNVAQDKMANNGWSDNTLNVLRGYGTEGNTGQALREAISVLSREGVSGLYQTNDYGLPAIRFNNGTKDLSNLGLNTTAPTFSTAYDPTWNMPSLYDQVNSSYGWGDQSINLADPNVRAQYPEWSQKLTADQVLQFQNGSVPADVMQAVAQFGAAVPGYNVSNITQSTQSDPWESAYNSLFDLYNQQLYNQQQSYTGNQYAQQTASQPVAGNPYTGYGSDSSYNTTGAQDLSELYPRVDWGNYQSTDRGSRYFDSTTGTYGNSTTNTNSTGVDNTQVQSL
jgi:hypothetical protein